jgi:hypothetical protein
VGITCGAVLLLIAFLRAGDQEPAGFQRPAGPIP